MNFCEIKPLDIANGWGVRVSLFVAGCVRRCPGCFNPETWDFLAGKPFDVAAEEYVLSLLAPNYVNGLTLLGGEPFAPQNQRALLPFLQRVRMAYPQKDIWAFTGYVYDRDLIPGGEAWCEATEPMLDRIHVLVDGPFIAAQKDVSLQFRGSSNQRVLDLDATRKRGSLQTWTGLVEKT